jgi:hypothetical protein
LGGITDFFATASRSPAVCAAKSGSGSSMLIKVEVEYDFSAPIRISGVFSRERFTAFEIRGDGPQV